MTVLVLVIVLPLIAAGLTVRLVVMIATVWLRRTRARIDNRVCGVDQALGEIVGTNLCADFVLECFQLICARDGVTTFVRGRCIDE